MATKLPEATRMANPYRARLADLSPAERDNSSWLIVAHDDPLLIQRIESAMEGDQVVVLQVPQGDWYRDRALLAEAIATILPTSGISNVALLGHSQANASKCRPHLVAKEVSGAKSTEPASEYDCARRIDAPQTAQSNRECPKQDLAEQFHYLAEHEELAPLADERDVGLHAFFYMAESGLFLKYDNSTRGFRC